MLLAKRKNKQTLTHAQDKAQNPIICGKTELKPTRVFQTNLRGTTRYALELIKFQCNCHKQRTARREVDFTNSNVTSQKPLCRSEKKSWSELVVRGVANL